MVSVYLVVCVRSCVPCLVACVCVGLMSVSLYQGYVSYINYVVGVVI